MARDIKCRAYGHRGRPRAPGQLVDRRAPPASDRWWPVPAAGLNRVLYNIFYVRNKLFKTGFPRTRFKVRVRDMTRGRPLGIGVPKPRDRSGFSPMAGNNRLGTTIGAKGSRRRTADPPRDACPPDVRAKSDLRNATTTVVRMYTGISNGKLRVTFLFLFFFLYVRS